MQSNFFKVTERPSSYSYIKFAHSFLAASQECEQGWCVVAIGGGKNDGVKEQKESQRKMRQQTWWRTNFENKLMGFIQVLKGESSKTCALGTYANI